MLVVVVAVIIVYYDYNKSDDNVFVLSCSGQLLNVGLVVMNTTLIHNIHQNLQTIFNVSSNGLQNGRSACHIFIQMASGPLLVISISLRHLFLLSGRFNLFKSGVKVTIYDIYVPCVRYWAFVVAQLAIKYQQRVQTSLFCHKGSS